MLKSILLFTFPGLALIAFTLGWYLAELSRN